MRARQKGLALIAALAGLSACLRGGDADQEPAGPGRYMAFDGEEPAEVVALLPAGVPASALRIGDDHCYYYAQGARMVALHRGNDPAPYCIG